MTVEHIKQREADILGKPMRIAPVADEATALVGQYQALGYIQNSLRMPLFEGNPGLAAR